MGQHRTRKQKELAQLHRQEVLAHQYSLKDISFSPQKKNTAAQTPTLFSQEQRKWLYRDMLKTLLVSLVMIALLALAWWKLR